MDSLIFDTTFLIDLHRERKASKAARTRDFLRSHSEKAACLSVVAYGEFAEGFKNLSDPAYVSLVESFEILPITRSIAERYAEITRTLRRGGQLIGANDLWIAATALECGFPLVTRNVDHFCRIPDLQLLGY